MAVDLKARNELNDIFVSIYDVVAKSETESIQNGPFPDLSVAEMHTVAAIGRDGKSTMGDVAARLDVTMGTLSVSVKKLEKKGYAVRTTAENDRRLVLVALTEKGRRAERVHQYFHDVMIKKVMADMTDEEAAVLKEALTVLKNYFDQYLSSANKKNGKGTE